MNELGKSFLKSLKNEFSDVPIEMLEMVVDEHMMDGILKEMPVVSYLYRINNCVLSVRDYLYVQKITEFMNDISKTDLQTRLEFLNKIGDESKKLSDSIISIIERCDSKDKVHIFANLFKNYMHENITKDEFFRMCNVTDKTYIGDLNYLSTESNSDGFWGIEAASLTNSNLTVRYTFDGGTWGGIDTKVEVNENLYRLTEFGKKYKKYAFSEWHMGDVNSIT